MCKGLNPGHSHIRYVNALSLSYRISHSLCLLEFKPPFSDFEKPPDSSGKGRVLLLIEKVTIFCNLALASTAFSHLSLFFGKVEYL